jgi:hypothetical protein
LKRYRDSCLPLMQTAINEDPAKFSGFTQESLADLLTAYIEGCALRFITEPQNNDIEPYAGTLAALLNSR